MSIKTGTRIIFEKIAIGIERKKRIHFLNIEMLSAIYAKIAPMARNEINDLKPLHGLPTTSIPFGIVILNPSKRIGTPSALTKTMLILATMIFKGIETVEIMARGSGNIKIRNTRGKIIILVCSFPKRKRTEPNTKKNTENPDMEKI
jgi:hypothetical protein